MKFAFLVVVFPLQWIISIWSGVMGKISISKSNITPFAGYYQKIYTDISFIPVKIIHS